MPQTQQAHEVDPRLTDAASIIEEAQTEIAGLTASLQALYVLCGTGLDHEGAEETLKNVRKVLLPGAGENLDDALERKLEDVETAATEAHEKDASTKAEDIVELLRAHLYLGPVILNLAAFDEGLLRDEIEAAL